MEAPGSDLAAPDAVLVQLLDRALDAGVDLRSIYADAGDVKKVEALDRALSFLSGRRKQAVGGTLHGPHDGPALGISRALGDYEWGPEGEEFLEAGFAVERHWSGQA